MRRRSASSAERVSARGETSCCVAEVMGTELFTLTPDTVVGSALRLANAKRIQHFLVIEDGSLTGIVCADDLKQARTGALVGECMSSPVLCIGPETTLHEAAEIMSENAIGCLPIVTGAFLVGVITRDRLAGLGVKADVTAEEITAAIDEETEETEEQVDFCVACGSDKRVKRDVRAGLMPLCADCSAVIPSSTEPLRGN